ncbi:hypothetical protein TruAng_001826 [Truncatella angustata]|nr:hypothetical protein TruAng_001826 [Truncatella angustata]
MPKDKDIEQILAPRELHERINTLLRREDDAMQNLKYLEQDIEELSTIAKAMKLVGADHAVQLDMGDQRVSLNFTIEALTDHIRHLSWLSQLLEASASVGEPSQIIPAPRHEPYNKSIEDSVTTMDPSGTATDSGEEPRLAEEDSGHPSASKVYTAEEMDQLHARFAELKIQVAQLQAELSTSLDHNYPASDSSTTITDGSTTVAEEGLTVKKTRSAKTQPHK